MIRMNIFVPYKVYIFKIYFKKSCLIKFRSILIKTMPIFKTPYFCNDIMLSIIDNLKKELVNSITVDSNIFCDVVV